MWISTQSPHETALAAARTLGLGVAQVRMHMGDVGGGFGQKVFLGREEIAVMVCSRRLDRPVCWIEGRSENLTSSNHARRDRADVCLGASADGRFVAATVYTNTCGRGAYRGPWQMESVARPQSASSRWRR